MQDPNYKRLFSFPRMAGDLLRAFLPGEVLAELDFSSLDKLPAEYVSDELLQRHGDCVWRLRRRGRWLYLLVLLEFQSTEVRRLAASRFGAETAERLSPVGSAGGHRGPGRSGRGGRMAGALRDGERISRPHRSGNGRQRPATAGPPGRRST